MKKENRKYRIIRDYASVWLEFGNFEAIELEAGTSDELHVYREGDFVYVMSTNSGLGYVGIQQIGFCPNPYTHDSTFVQNASEYYVDGGRSLDEFAPVNQTKLLAMYMQQYK